MAQVSPRPGIGQIKPFRPTRDSNANQALINLSLNENPLGSSPRAIEALRGAATRIHRYPDARVSTLRMAIAGKYDLDPERIVIGNGSEELIQLLSIAYAGPGDEILFHEYGFLGFNRAARLAGATPMTARERDLTADIDALAEKAGERTRIVFLANPNNPTGTYVSADEVRALRAALPPDALLVVDAAYAEYVGRSDYSAGSELVESFDNVVMLRSFSKLYGLAGLRVGWAYASHAVVDNLNRARAPFNVNVVAEAAATAAVGDLEHEQASLAHNARWMPWLAEAFQSIGIKVYPSVCNFLLVRVPADPAIGVIGVTEHLWRRGIVVKHLADYGLPDCLRITVGHEIDNRALIDALSEILS